MEQQNLTTNQQIQQYVTEYLMNSEQYSISQEAIENITENNAEIIIYTKKYENIVELN
jgi:hypothetical protein